jgi:ribonuclease P protein component
LKGCERLRPEQRLRKQSSFKDLVEKGSFVRGRFFYVWVAANRERKTETGAVRPAIGIVVNRKTQPLATARNTLKRRVREIFRKRQDEFKDGIAVLVKAREGSAAPEFQDAEKELMELFKKSGALK